MKTIKQLSLLTVMLTVMAFSSVAQHTLTDADVVVTDGIIISCSYSFTLKDIIIPNILDAQTIIGIGNDFWYLFENKGITSITLPSTIKTIGNHAFQNNNLTSITIPNSVTYIGASAFSKNNLTSVTIPNTVTSIGNSAFRFNNLNTVAFEDNSNIASLGIYAFVDNTDLTSLTLPTNTHPNFTEYTDGNGNTYNTGDAIINFRTLYYLDIPYTLTDDNVVVTNGIVESCNYNFAIKVIIIPKTLDGQSVIGIGNDYWSLFRDKDITSITLPSTIKTIGNRAFKDNNLTSVTIPNTVTSIGNYAFRYNNLNTVTFEDNSNIASLGTSAFADNTDLTSITLPTNIQPNFTEYTDGNGNTYNAGDALVDFESNYYLDIPYTLTDDDVVVTNGIIESCSCDFVLKVIIIPKTLDGQSVIGIGNDFRSLFGNKGITSITLPTTIKTIGNQAFKDNNLTSVTIPNTVTSIGNSAFRYNNLTTVTFEYNSNIVSIEISAFYNNRGLTSITLPTHAHRSFIEYTDGNSNTYSAGYEITDFTTSYYANIAYTLADDDVTVTNGLIESCSYNFFKSQIIIPEILDEQIITGIGNDSSNLFYNKGITSITLPSTIKHIDCFAFQNNKLTSIYIPNSITSIGRDAFKSNNLNTVTFEDNSNIVSLGTSAFADNSDLTSITLPTNAHPNFTEYTEGNGNIYNEYDKITNFESNYYLDIPYTLTDDDVVVTNGTIDSCSYSFVLKVIIIPETLDEQTVTAINGIEQLGVFENKDIISIKLPSTIKHIGDFAFRHNSLTSVTIPNSVTSVGFGAFKYNSLNTVTFEDNSNIVSIGTSTFADNSDLTSITLPINTHPNFTKYTEGNGNTYNAYDTITNFESNYYLNIPYTLTDDDVVVTNGIIDSCNYSFALKVIIIPDTLGGQTVTGINDAKWSGVFENKDIASIKLPKTIKHIGDRSFRYNNLTSITIPDSVTNIGNDAFRSNNLTTVTIEDTSCIREIGSYAFANNTSLTSITLPTHAHIDFIKYADTNGNVYNIGDTITNFKTSYYTQISYTLTDNDVVVINGFIESCSYSFELKNIIIPDTLDGQIITGIADTDWPGIFGKKDIASIKLPETIKYIGYYAFLYNKLTSVTIPNSVTHIGGFAFCQNNLTSIVIPNSIVAVNYSAFKYNDLTTVTFEDNSNIVSIGTSAFANNSYLTSITLPTNTHPNFTEYTEGNGNIYNEYDTITNFKSNYYLNIPYTLTDDDVVVTNGIIDSCSYNFALKVITIPEILDGQTVTGIGDVDWPGVFGLKDIASIQIPTTMEYIGAYTFSYNNLSSITIPNSVSHIGYAAFAYNNLTNVNFKLNSSISSIGKYAFIQNSGLTSITLPTNAHPNFTEYTDDEGNIYNESNKITDFYTHYYLNIPYNLTASQITRNSATLSWKDAGLATTWSVSWAESEQTYLHTVIVTDKEYMLTGLSEDKTYTFYVRSHNSEDDLSEFSASYNFTTLTVGVDDVLNSNIVVYPNPAKNIINIESNNALGSVSVINQMGQIVYLKNNLQTNKNIQIDVSNFEQGIYVIKTINNGSVNLSQIVIK